MALKTVLAQHPFGSQHWVGDGFPVRNLFPSNGVSGEVNPFLMFDYAGPTDFPPSSQPRGVDQHPHRGFETVTIAYQGSVDHRDSAGNSGTIHPGDVQWMTAASGIVHEEKHGRDFTTAGGTFEMVQLWVNLPAAAKKTPPRYQPITRAQIPSIELGPGAVARVIAGELAGARGPAQTFTPLTLIDLRLAAGARATLSLPEGQNTGLVLLRGDVTVQGEPLRGEARLALLSPAGQSVELTAAADSLLLLLGGEPINEPVVSYGPFVMNTMDEIREAMADYRAGRMGRLS
ncbi:MAG: pirin family protein [Acidobacteriota bacterium]|jgi:redox-sensitive bicupin YhaK (pirin superfamily)|nr:pirin family protein [Bryobacteraceae bacterium CoA2 C42]MCA2963248.1 pirin family protein [Acidobacteriaceae bacterium]